MNRGEHYFLAAQRMLDIGQVDQAVEMLRMVLAEDPEFAEGHALLAICLIHQKRLHAARHEARAALALEAQSPLALYAMALASMLSRKLSEAEGHLDTLIAIDPTDPANYQLQARLRRLQGREAEILPILEKARAIDPENTETSVMIAEHLIEKGALAEAEPILHEVLGTTPEHQDALVQMGTLRLKQGRVEEAYEHAVWALRQNPADQPSLHLLAAIKARQSRLWGLWWRFNVKLSELGEIRAIVVLLAMFVVYRLITIFAGQHDQDLLAIVVQIAWLGLCIYSWVGPAIFRRKLHKELKTITLKPEF